MHQQPCSFPELLSVVQCSSRVWKFPVWAVLQKFLLIDYLKLPNRNCRYAMKCSTYGIQVNLSQKENNKQSFGWLNHHTSEHWASFSTHSLWMLLDLGCILNGYLVVSLALLWLKIAMMPARDSGHDSCTWHKAGDGGSLIWDDYPFWYCTPRQMHG